MQIDHFDQTVLDQKGNASEIMLDLYGEKLGKHGAEKQLAGIRKHIRHKLGLDERYIPDPDQMEEIHTKADGTVTTKRMMYLSDEDSKNPNRVMYLMGYDPGLWKLISCKTKRNYWDVTMKISKGNVIDGFDQYPVKRTNHAYTCEIVVKPIDDGINSNAIKEILAEIKVPELQDYRYKNDGSGIMLELPIMDLHLGKLAWAEETGDENWNLKKAEKIYKKAIVELLERVNQYRLPIEIILFPIGQDYFHFDTKDNKTARGTQMDTDSRWIKMFQTGVELLVWAIESLRSFAPVKVFWIPGNHDTMLSYFAVHSVASWFRDVDTVDIDLSPTPRKYYRYGKCLIGFAHGQDEKNRIEKLMQVEAAKDWGNTIFREFHLGHIHREHVNEDGGLIVRNIGSLTAIDSWHKNMGFVGAVRKMQGIVWNKERGKQLTIDVNVKM